MTVTQIVLLLYEVAALLRVSPATIRRWVAERRAGRGNFILPISEPGQQLRFLASDVESFLQTRSSVKPQVNVVNSVTAQCREAKVVKWQRASALAEATATLERHRIGRKPK